MPSKTSENAFVMFYAPWCGHCQTAKPEFKKALGGKAEDFGSYRNRAISGGTKLVMVNADDHPNILEQFGVTGFPTFKLLHGVSDRKKLTNFKMVDYNGNRDANNFELFLKNAFTNNQMGGAALYHKERDPYYKLYKKYKAKYKNQNK